MKSVQALLPVFGLVAAVQAGFYGNETTVYTTETVSTLTTYCPEATTFTQGTKTYTATASQTLTITDCPCTIKKPIPTTSTTPAGTGTPAPPAPPVWVTTTVSAYTTYCPLPTTIVQNNVTYTATSATTLTISNCPCTISYPASTSTTKIVSSLTTFVPVPTTIVVGPVTTALTTPGTYTIPVATVVPTPASVPAVTPKPSAPAATTAPLQANGAEKIGAGLGAFVGLAAMLL